MRNHAAFVSLDDKHRVKVGEPNFPVASAERGRQVIIPTGAQLLAQCSSSIQMVVLITG